MSWAARRRLIILIIIGAVISAFLFVIFISAFVEEPSCADGVQNQDESGIDCGGSCMYLCFAEVQPPITLFTKALPNTLGRTDIIAMVENKNNHAAARDVPYRLTLFGSDQTLIQEVTGKIDLPPASSVPVYVPGIVSGQQVVTRAFLSISDDAPKWYRASRTQYTTPRILDVEQTGTTERPRIEAIIENPSSTKLFQIFVVAMVRDESGNVIAASQTVAPNIESGGKEDIVFTWNTAFSAPVTIIDIVPTLSIKE